MTNLFVAFSNNQIKNCALLLDGLKEDNNILVTSNSLQFNQYRFSEVISIEGSFDNRSDNILDSLSTIINKIKLSKSIIAKLNGFKQEKNIKLYFFYVEDILTNYLLFSFNPHLKGVAIEDGTLNYYKHTIKSLSRAKVLSKWCLCKLYNIPFVIYKGHSSGIEYNHVECQYVRAPKLSLFPNKSRQLKYYKKSFIPSNSFLIVGQEPYVSAYGREVYVSHLKRIIHLIRATEDFTIESIIYYKPHRHGGRIDDNFLLAEFPKNEILVLDAESPLEDLYFQKLKSKYILGFESSVFINIYLETEQETREHIKFTVLMLYNKQLRSIFERFNFNIIE